MLRMNKKIITSLTLGVFFSFVVASSTHAFWPFDALFKKSGDVKAETTDESFLEGEGDMMIRTKVDSKVYMTYQTLTTMNDVCRQMFAKTYPSPDIIKLRQSTSNSDRSVPVSSSELEKLYEKEFNIKRSSENELNSIYNNLKARCDNITNLVIRMKKIYTGDTRPISIVKSQDIIPTTDDQNTKDNDGVKNDDGNITVETPTQTDTLNSTTKRKKRSFLDIMVGRNLK